MTPYRKKLIEVALPLEAINKESAREKSIRHGHPSTLHLWWARRPLAACRAVLFASLVDDPDSDPAYANYDAETREHMAGEKRQQLFELIEELVKWENSNNELVINAARAEIARCVASRKIETGELKKDQKLPGGETVYDLVVKGHGDLKKLRANLARLPKAESVNAFLAEHAPPVLDPFCGGGSIPLEAQRLGLRAYASDLNPVPVLITKALIEIPPKFANQPPVNPEARQQGKINETWKGAQGLADDVRYYGKWMRDEAEKKIGHLYPKVKITAEMAKERPDLKPYVGEELAVIAWLWTRTLPSPDPACGQAEVPLIRSFVLSKKAGGEAWFQAVADRTTSSYRFVVRVGKPPGTIQEGTVSRSGGTCLLTGTPIPFTYIRQAGNDGLMKSRLMAIVVATPDGRTYLSPTPEHEKLALSIVAQNYPETRLPLRGLGIQTQLYGYDHHHKLFTQRQLMLMSTLADLVAEAHQRVLRDANGHHLVGEDAAAYAEAVATYLGLGVSKVADYNNTLVTWIVQRDQAGHAFTRQTLQMVWDFTEVNPLVGAAGDITISLRGIAKSIGIELPVVGGEVEHRDATAATLRDREILVSTDPPYYDNIGYSDLSDFFYIWLRRSLGRVYPLLFATVLTPKDRELIASPHRHGNDRQAAKRFFEDGFTSAFEKIMAAHSDDLPVTVFYAFRQSEEDEGDSENPAETVATTSSGWETMLEGLIRGGFVLTGTWPIRTERGSRMRDIGSNALASSIVLVCRKRPVDAALATRREFLTALKRELPDALKYLQRGSIAPVDVAQASIGPGMAVFSRYAKVMEADGSPMTVRQALSLINQALDEVLAEQEGEFDSDTRWALAWFEQFGVEEGPFGVAETLSKAKNTAVRGLVEAGMIHARGGKVRLLRRDELPADWNPATDTRLRHWEIVQHLIRTLETGGEPAAADLLRRLGGMGETARDLAYRLYNICERKGWASEALSYNGLVIAWPEITRLAQSAPAVVATQEQFRY